MNKTPQSNRLHIAIIGKRNSGKSSLINALTGQEAALVSDTPGTTTDLVYKAMEIRGVGPCLFIDTPGFDDEGELGNKRVEQTKKALERADIAILLCDKDTEGMDFWVQTLAAKHTPFIFAINKLDLWDDKEELASFISSIEEKYEKTPLTLSAKSRLGIDGIIEGLIRNTPEDQNEISITGSLVQPGDLVLLVIPQDIQAPAGRLILPQVQTLRELLDKKCIIVSCSTEQLAATFKSLRHPPKLIITDSQVLKTVYELKPLESKLTSFSVLFAQYKGDIDYFRTSAVAIESLTESSRVLVAEACTHAPEYEDIGRVKIPRLLRKRIGEGLSIEVVSGSDFPSDLKPYDLIIHCGGCMFNRKHVLSRVESAKGQQVPMTNYGIAIAYLNDIELGEVL